MRRLIAALTAGAALVTASPAPAQPEVHVADLPIECWPTDAHRYIETTFAPPNDALTLKFYFRSVTSPDFHFLEATTNLQGRAVAILPIAEPRTTRVEIFAELVTRSYVAFRTEPRVVPVMPSAQCTERDPAVSWYQGQDADITVGATRPGNPMPLGFRPDGISRFVGVTGPAEGGGGSRMPLVLAGAGGAAAAGAFVLAGGSDENDTGPPTGGGPSTTSGPTTSVVGGGGGPTTTIGGGGGPSTTTTPGAPTTTTPGGSTTSSVTGPGTTTSVTGSTTTSPGSTTSTPGSTTTTPGSTTSPTSVPSTSTTSSPPTTSIDPGVVADVGVSISSPSSAVLLTGFNVTVTGFNNGPDPASVFGRVPVPSNAQKTGGACGTGSLLVCNFGVLGPNGSGQMVIGFRGTSVGNVTFTVEVNSNTDSDSDPSNDNDASVTLITSSLKADSSLEVGLLSELRPASGEIQRAQVLVNGANTIWVDPGILRLRIPARAGLNELEARPTAGSTGGTWRLDFAETGGELVPGSLKVLSGEVVSTGPSAVVVRLGGDTIRVQFELRAPSQD